MASIYKTPGGWRAQVARCGQRVSRTFLDEDSARKWAKEQETRILSRTRNLEKRKEAVLLANVPRRVLQAIEGCPFKADEVLDAPIPWPMSSGVYFLIRDNEIKYVGQSIDVLKRISRHRDNGYRFDYFNVVFAPPSELDKLEKTYIEAMLPPWNEHVGRHEEKKVELST